MQREPLTLWVAIGRHPINTRRHHAMILIESLRAVGGFIGSKVNMSASGSLTPLGSQTKFVNAKYHIHLVAASPDLSSGTWEEMKRLVIHKPRLLMGGRVGGWGGWERAGAGKHTLGGATWATQKQSRTLSCGLAWLFVLIFN